MRTKCVLLFVGVATVVAVTSTLRHRRHSPPPDTSREEAQFPMATEARGHSETQQAERATVQAQVPEARSQRSVPEQPADLVTNKLDRLKQTRETFIALAAGDPAAAMRAAKQITDEAERETALLTLATEWTHGELGSPRRRAHLIDSYGLEAGIGMELRRNPELAVLWANELTDGVGRVMVLEQAAVNLAPTDPNAALALADQLSETDRRDFLKNFFAGWGGADTEAAFGWADLLSDPAERDAAIQAIRTSAPVGIGAELKMQDGYAVINGLIPGSPAELSGQIHPGDRILALAQGDSVFMDARGLSLAQIVEMIRGQPNTVLQMQVLPADPAGGTVPRTITIPRDQLKFKRPAAAGDTQQ